jgi:hypothetical protein
MFVVTIASADRVNKEEAPSSIDAEQMILGAGAKRSVAAAHMKQNLVHICPNQICCH